MEFNKLYKLFTSTIIPGLAISYGGYTALLQVKAIGYEIEKEVSTKFKILEKELISKLEKERHMTKRELDLAKGEVKLERAGDISTALGIFEAKNTEAREKQLVEQDARIEAKIGAKLAEQDARIEAKMDAKLAEQDARIEAKMDAMLAEQDARIEAKMDAMLAEQDARIEAKMDAKLDEKLSAFRSSLLSDIKQLLQ